MLFVNLTLAVFRPGRRRRLGFMGVNTGADSAAAKWGGAGSSIRGGARGVNRRPGGGRLMPLSSRILFGSWNCKEFNLFVNNPNLLKKIRGNDHLCTEKNTDNKQPRKQVDQHKYSKHAAKENLPMDILHVKCQSLLLTDSHLSANSHPNASITIRTSPSSARRCAQSIFGVLVVVRPIRNHIPPHSCLSTYGIAELGSEGGA